MKFEIVEDQLSGDMAKIYSVVILDDNNPSGDTLYDKFIETYNPEHQEEIEDIEDALNTMGSVTGLRSNRIIPFEGENFGDGIVAICDRPNKALRVYSIMYGDYIVILGGGGEKPGGGRLKNYPALDEAQKLIVKVKKFIDLAVEANHLSIKPSGILSTTNYIYNSEDYE